MAYWKSSKTCKCDISGHLRPGKSAPTHILLALLSAGLMPFLAVLRATSNIGYCESSAIVFAQREHFDAKEWVHRVAEATIAVLQCWCSPILGYTSRRDLI